MCRRSKQTFLQRRHTDSQQTHEKMLNIAYYSVSSVSQLCLTLCNPVDCSIQSLSITNSWSLLKLMSIESVMPLNHLIFCCSLLLLPSIFSSIRVFSDESVFCIRWPKCWSFSFSISPSFQ